MSQFRIVIPSEREGSWTDFSLWSKQGFLAAPEMTEEGKSDVAVLRHSLESEGRVRGTRRWHSAYKTKGFVCEAITEACSLSLRLHL
jgi:hypothetical protein